MTPFHSPEPFRSLYYHGDAGAGGPPARTGKHFMALIHNRRTETAAARVVLRASVNSVQGQRADKARKIWPGRAATSQMRRGLGYNDPVLDADHGLPIQVACQAPFFFNAQHPHKIRFL